MFNCHVGVGKWSPIDNVQAALPGPGMGNLSEVSIHVQPIYIPKVSCPSIAKGGWPANFLCILKKKKKKPRVWLAGPQEDQESMEKREKVVRQTLRGRRVGVFIPFK